MYENNKKKVLFVSKYKKNNINTQIVLHKISKIGKKQCTKYTVLTNTRISRIQNGQFTHQKNFFSSKKKY